MTTPTAPTPTERDQLLWDIFVTALEGGIDYWAEASRYRIWKRAADGTPTDSCDEDHRGFYADISDIEQGGDYRVDRRIVARGYRLATTTHRHDIRWSSGQTPPLVITADSDWDFDASDADAIIQLGLWGEVVYG